MRSRLPRLSTDQGFTLVEVLMAATILLVGLVGTFVLIDGANGMLHRNNARIAANNLAREVVEHARSTDYDRLNPAQVAAALQEKPGLGGSGNPWTLSRRGVSYETTVSVCTVDDPKDGLGAAAPDNACPRANPIAGAPTETNPDDFRKVEVTLSWTANGRPRSVKQSALIVNPSGGLGPRISAFPEPAGQITSGTTVSWNGTLTTTGAASVHWSADDGLSQGDATGGSTAWTLVWNIGTYGTAPYVVDGAYTVSAQAFDSRGIAGESRLAAVLLNRRVPFAPSSLSGGRNVAFGGEVVDLMWAPSRERDVVGYRVYRLDLLGNRESQICPGAGNYLKSTSCTDDNPDPLLSRYDVVAVDRADLAQATSALREGDSAYVTVPPAATAPPAPTNLTAATDPSVGLPWLTWTQAAATPPVLFFRIYRDPASSPPTLGDRYAYTATSDPTWSDPDPGSATQHDYWVSTVDSSFNESAPTGPVTWTAP
jgi:prepilin-type N-terminal cleavage/methylation domain-containing protein